jgi:DNA adenine methylase
MKKTPITYYGGKQKLVNEILPLIPVHNLYAEPFFGGGAIFFAKPQSAVEVINDTNTEVMNFYKTVQNNFIELEKHVKISLHSRKMYNEASVVYNNPDMFNEIKRAWAFWTLSAQGFAGMIDGSWGYDISKNTTSKKIANKRDAFTEDFAIRLQNSQIECTDAIRIITSRDNDNAFFYCDPPYVGSNCGHYDGYTQSDFDELLQVLSKIKGKFLLSSYPNDKLKEFVKANGWYQRTIEMGVTVAAKYDKPRKIKTEVLTANYPI